MLPRLAGCFRHVVVLCEIGAVVDPLVEATPNVSVRYFPVQWQHKDLEILGTALTKEFGSEWLTFALDDFTTVAAATLAELFEKPLFTPKAATTTILKSELRALWNRLCQTHAIEAAEAVSYSCLRFQSLQNSARWELCSGVSPLSLRFPVFIKPNALDASTGVIQVTRLEDLAEGITHTFRCLQAVGQEAVSIGYALPPEIIIEEAIPLDPALGGHGEFSATMASRDRRHYLFGIVDKLQAPAIHSELGHILPAISFPNDLEGQVEQALSILLSRLDVTLGLSSWDFKLTRNGRIALIEGHMRPSGNHIPRLFFEVFKRDLYEWLLDPDFYAATPKRSSTVAGVLFPFPVKPLTQVVEVESDQASAECVVDRRLFTVRNWQGALDGSRAYVAMIASAEEPSRLGKVLLHACEKTRLVGLDTAGSPCAVPITLPAGLQLGGNSVRLGWVQILYDSPKAKTRSFGSP